MSKKRILMGAGLITLAAALQAHAQDTGITIVLNEELEVLEPCMTSQSNIGRVLLQNVSETMTELDAADGTLKPRLAESWEDMGNGTWRFHLREGRHLLGRHALRRHRRRRIRSPARCRTS